MLEFLWKYFAGPIIAEALGRPITWRGVEAVAGYNIYNTVAWAVFAVLTILSVQRFLESKKIELDPSKTFRLLPLIMFAGMLRFVQDALNLPLIVEVLLITPIIYIWIAAVALLFLYLDEKRELFAHFTGLLIVLSIALIYFLPTINLIPVVAVTLASALVSAIYYYIFEGQKYSESPLIFAVMSQFFEAFASMYAVSEGFQPRQILTSIAYELAGPLGFLMVKVGLLYLALRIYFDVDKRWKSILLIALYSIGFATGIRVLLRVATGV